MHGEHSETILAEDRTGPSPEQEFCGGFDAEHWPINHDRWLGRLEAYPVSDGERVQLTLGRRAGLTVAVRMVTRPWSQGVTQAAYVIDLHVEGVSWGRPVRAYPSPLQAWRFAAHLADPVADGRRDTRPEDALARAWELPETPPRLLWALDPSWADAYRDERQVWQGSRPASMPPEVLQWLDHLGLDANDPTRLRVLEATHLRPEAEVVWRRAADHSGTREIDSAQAEIAALRNLLATPRMLAHELQPAVAKLSAWLHASPISDEFAQVAELTNNLGAWADQLAEALQVLDGDGGAG